MKKLILGLIACVIVVAVLCATALSQNKDVADVKAAQEALWQAQQKGDMRAVMGYLTDDCITTHSNGTVTSPDPKATPSKGELHGLQVTVYGDAALVRGEAVFPGGQIPGKPVTRNAIWVKDGGKWKEVAVHLTSIGDTAPVQSIGFKPSTITGTNDDERAVLKLLQGLQQCTARHDAAAYAVSLTGEFIRVTNDGKILSRVEWLQRLKDAAKNPPLKVSDTDDMHVRIHGNAAVVTRGDMPYTANGSPQRMTHFFVKQGGKWLLAMTRSCWIHPPQP
jgi:ketosteroid isomerase-like protein